MKMNLGAAGGEIRHGTVTFLKNSVKKEIHFPSCILSTNAGCVPNLTAETLAYIPSALLPGVRQVPLPSLVDHEKAVAACPGSGNEFMCLPPSTFTVATTMDPLLGPRNSSKSGYNTSKAVSIWGNSGRVQLTSEKHMQLMSTLKPDFYEALADGDTTAGDVSKKRISKSYNNSLNFLEECLELHGKNESFKSSLILTMLEGGNDKQLRKKFALEALGKIKAADAVDVCAGFVVDGIQNDRPLTESDTECVRASVDNLPQDKLRFISGPRSPREVFTLLETGIDVFDTSYPSNCAYEYKALIFNIPTKLQCIGNGNTDDGPVTEGTLGTGVADDTLDLSDETHKESFEPILDGCTCYACERHTRAYIHHLVSTREMLAPILLTLHNLQHYLTFFDSLRKSLHNGCYEKFKKLTLGEKT